MGKQVWFYSNCSLIFKIMISHERCWIHRSENYCSSATSVSESIHYNLKFPFLFKIAVNNEWESNDNSLETVHGDENGVDLVTSICMNSSLSNWRALDIESEIKDMLPIIRKYLLLSKTVKKTSKIQGNIKSFHIYTQRLHICALMSHVSKWHYLQVKD